MSKLLGSIFILLYGLVHVFSRIMSWSELYQKWQCFSSILCPHQIICSSPLTSKTVVVSALLFKGIDHKTVIVPLVMLSAINNITDNIVKKNFEETMGLFVCEARDMFDTTSQGSRLTLSQCLSDDRTLVWNDWG